MSIRGDEPPGRTGLFDRLAGEKPARLWTVLGGVASVVAALIAVLALAFNGSSAPTSAPPTAASVSPTPNVSSVATSDSPPSSTPSPSVAAEGVQYLGTAFYLARHAHRFQATVGPTDDAAQSDHIQYELVTETGSTLFTSSVLSVGQTQPADVSVEGVLRLFLIAKLVGQGVGAQGTAGWGDPRVMTTELTCP